MSDRITGSRHSPSKVQVADQSSHHIWVSCTAKLASTGRGAASWLGYQVRTKGMCSVADTVKSATVVMSSPRVSIGVHSARASGPATAHSRPSSAPHPGHHRPVAEADDEVHAHGDLAADGFDHPDDLGVVLADGHAVDHPGDAVGGLELGLEDERVAAVAAPDLVVIGGRRDAPVAVSSLPSNWAKQASESNRGRHSQSIDPLRPTSATVWRSPMIP